MNISLDKVFTFLESLYGLPKAPLVLIFCIAVGWIYKRTPIIPNGSIPLLVALSGAVALPLISDFPHSAVQSTRAFYTLNVIIGFISGSLATACHRWLIKPILAKFGIKDDNTTTFVNKPPTP